MFTGRIKDIGELRECRTSGLRIRTKLIDKLRPGESVAVNGVCLTVARLGRGDLWADVMQGTWKNTNLQFLRAGMQVNLEPALRQGDSLDGHLVSGHVDGMGKVKTVRLDREALLLAITVPRQWLNEMVSKGAVAVNGVSLTIQSISRDEFTVSLIPSTQRETTLGSVQSGKWVNIETDWLLKGREGRKEETGKVEVTRELLAKNGFL